MAKDFHSELLKSDDFAQYSLRSTFFLRQLRLTDLWSRIKEVRNLLEVSAQFPWNQRKEWGIEDEAWKRLKTLGINPLLVFCHPKVLSQQPILLMYYRAISLLSIKGLSTLAGGDLKKIESGKVSTLNSSQAQNFSIAINSVVSAILTAAPDFSNAQMEGIQFAAMGATIQGSWNNAVGSAGEAAVRSILFNRLGSEISQIVWKDNTSVTYTKKSHAKILDCIDEVKLFRLEKGFSMVFSSEPDIELRDRNDLPVVAAEVKAGTDPAGALERLGAAMKSFDNDRSQNPRLKTIYIVRCMTPELRKRIDEQGFFDHTFSLATLMADEKTQTTFANLFMRVILGK